MNVVKSSGCSIERTHLWASSLAGLSLLLVGIGLGRFAYPPLIPALVEQHWFTVGQADYLAAINLAGYVIGAFVAGKFANRISATWYLRIAMLVVAAGFFACVKPAGLTWFSLWRLSAGIAAGFLMVLGVPAIIAKTPAEYRGRLGGVIFAGVGLGTVFAGTIIPLVVRHSLTAAWATVGLVILVPTSLTWPYWSKHKHFSLPPDTLQRGPAVRVNRTLVLLVAAYCTDAIGSVPHLIFWVDFITRKLGFGLTVGGRYWTLLGISAAAGPVIMGMIADRFGMQRSLRWSFLAMACSVALPLFSTRTWSLVMSSAGEGLLSMGITSLASGRVSELVPASAQKQVWGWMTVGFSVSYAGAALGLSAIFAHIHSFRLMFAIGSLALAAGFVFSLLSSCIALDQQSAAVVNAAGEK